MRTFQVEEESMAYKRVIQKAKQGIQGSTRESVTFSCASASTATATATSVTVRFRFDWAYDEGFSYTSFSDFSGHKRYTEEERAWLETYCRNHFPDPHHMSY